MIQENVDHCFCIEDIDPEFVVDGQKTRIKYPVTRTCCYPFICFIDCGIIGVRRLGRDAMDKITSMFCCLVLMFVVFFIVLEWQLATQLRNYGVDPPPSYVSYKTDTVRRWSASALREVADLVHNGTA
jgi:hypothetical protein